ncbi:phospholipase D-like domain-containing protein [Nocardioides kribbensis]|uniref:phospholipase D-like domain-containing protein n=1 Tax=Nocardioides kribbensis TaxID=305517 RepID=UPI0032DAC25C
MFVRRMLVGALVGLPLLLSGAVAVPSQAAPSATAASVEVSSVDRYASASGPSRQRAGGYTVPQGLLFNNPLNDRSHVINKHIREAIARTPAGERIRMITWNFKSELFVRSLRAAHQRGVSVRVIMSGGLAAQQQPDGSYRTLKRALAVGNKSRKAGMRSWFRVCNNSCRGKAGTGIVHSKFFLFSKVGTSRHVVMQGSGNLTESAANNQWDDLITLAGREKTYRGYERIFTQASRDKLHRPTFDTFAEGDYRSWFYPRLGRSDQVVDMLGKTRCKNVRKGFGINGRTQIRIMQSVFNGLRGEAVARAIRQKYNAGCNIRINYSVMTPNVRDILGPVPRRHIVQDPDGDGVYDRYLHIKSIAISGNYGGSRGDRIVLNGSANWSGSSLKSDEQGMIITRDGIVRQYISWANTLFANPPVSRVVAGRAATDVDPYAKAWLLTQ